MLHYALLGCAAPKHTGAAFLLAEVGTEGLNAGASLAQGII